MDYAITQAAQPVRRALGLDYAAMPFETMREDSDDSFVIALERGEPVGNLGRIVWIAAARRGVRVKVKRERAGLRVWRLSWPERSTVDATP